MNAFSYKELFTSEGNLVICLIDEHTGMRYHILPLSCLFRTLVDVLD